MDLYPFTTSNYLIINRILKHNSKRARLTRYYDGAQEPFIRMQLSTHYTAVVLQQSQLQSTPPLYSAVFSVLIAIMCLLQRASSLKGDFLFLNCEFRRRPRLLPDLKSCKLIHKAKDTPEKKKWEKSLICAQVVYPGFIESRVPQQVNVCRNLKALRPKNLSKVTQTSPSVV